MENKEKYITATVEVIAFDNSDIITTSGPGISLPMQDLEEMEKLGYF